jgi:hypothetical protein
MVADIKHSASSGNGKWPIRRGGGLLPHLPDDSLDGSGGPSWYSYRSFVCDLSRRLCFGNRLGATAKGRGAIIPWAAQKDDKVAIFCGDEVPYIIRETKNTGGYILIGDCFVDGIMDGEAVSECRANGEAPSTLWLV